MPALTTFAFDASPPESGTVPHARFDVRSAPATPQTHTPTGIVSNPRSHRNRGLAVERLEQAGVMHAMPETPEDLEASIVRFAAAGVELLVVDGGDGTVRDVLTIGHRIWDARPPRLLVVPSGKTNGLACDLGMTRGLTLARYLDLAPGASVKQRTPIEIRGEAVGCTTVCGFFFGAGAFVEATELAQKAHRAGAFNGLAVGLTLLWSMGQTLWGRGGTAWSAGTPMTIEYEGAPFGTEAIVSAAPSPRYVMLASTLHRMPLGLRPFGSPRAGLKTLLIDAPPRAMARCIPKLLLGSEASDLAARGYVRVDADAVDVDLAAGFILDGERYLGGRYTLRRGLPIEFVIV